MEEKKETPTENQPKQLSYEDLKNIAGQLQQQNMQMRKALSELNYENMFKRLDYLFEVIKVPHMFNDEFVGKCAEEIQSMLTIPEKDKEDNSEED
jgi:hypothetical protein